MSGALRMLVADLPQRSALFDHGSATAVAQRAQQVLRPTGALAALDRIAVHLAGWQHTTTPAVRRPAVLVFAADHGVADGDVSAYPASITREMLAAVRAGVATVNAMAAAAGATLEVIDVGVGVPTGDIRREPAMDPDRFDRVVAEAVAAVDAVVAGGADLLILGELGIGNTTIAAALAARLAGLPVDVAVGRGTGVDDDGLARKRAAVSAALDRVAGVEDPFELLRHLGGAEVAALAAAAVRARHHAIPLLLDGYVVAAAMLAPHVALPGCLDHALAGHQSAEPGHRLVLEQLDLRPILALDLRLGEGSGALAALPLLELACRAVTDVATFDEWLGAEAAPVAGADTATS